MSTDDLKFRAIVDEAIQRLGEVIVLKDVPYRAGHKEWFLFTEFAYFVDLVAKSTPRTAFSVFRKRELPSRQAVTLDIVDQFLEQITHHQEIMIADHQTDQGILTILAEFDAHDVETDEVKKWATEFKGTQVIWGRLPPWWLPNGEDVITAYVPDTDGIVRFGTY